MYMYFDQIIIRNDYYGVSYGLKIGLVIQLKFDIEYEVLLQTNDVFGTIQILKLWSLLKYRG